MCYIERWKNFLWGIFATQRVFGKHSAIYLPYLNIIDNTRGVISRDR